MRLSLYDGRPCGLLARVPCSRFCDRAGASKEWELANSERQVESLGGEEEVVGGVGDAEFLAGMCCVAAGGGGFATFGVEALDGGGAGEYAAAFMADDIDEEPGDGIGVRRRCIRNSFAGDAATVVGLPRGAGKMFAEGLAGGVE
jgi:hypothetical protein